MDAQTIFAGLALIVALVAVILAYKIGRKQNEINLEAVRLQDFAEVFLMPQQIIQKNEKTNKQKLLGWILLVQNASSYPIYINKYTLNDTEKEVGGSAIPNNPNSWYKIPIPKNITEFSVSIEFEDHRERRYKTDGDGVFNGKGWSIHSTRRVELK